jgi:ribosomal protein S27AE
VVRIHLPHHEKHYRSKEMKCPKCDIEMSEGKALTNTPSMRIPDFPGDTAESRGQTMTMDGPAIMVKVQKCPECGYSK